MAGNPLRRFTTRATGQDRPIPGSVQVPNSAGGHAWAVDDWTRLRRFLILGVDGPTYYSSEATRVVDNAEAVLRCRDADGARTVAEIVEISEAGRNPKQQPVVFALAACAAARDDAIRALALAALPRVCRTGTQLFLFAGYVEQFRGWGRGLRRAVADWYLDKDPDALAYQLVKYQQREGWSHRDLLRLAKPRPTRGGPTDLALAWAVGKAPAEPAPGLPDLLAAHEAALNVTTADRAAALVTTHGLPWEALRSEHLGDPVVWRALLPRLGSGALVRNLGRLTANGTLTSTSGATRTVAEHLTDGERIRRARLHPLGVLSALLTYRSGGGDRGRLTWSPIPLLLDALDEAFLLSFGNIQAAGCRTLLALDVSGSMAAGTVGGVPGLSPRLASAAMAAVTLVSEPVAVPVAFTSGGDGAWSSPLDYGARYYDHAITPLALSARQRLDDIVGAVSGLPFGGTDCALPMLYALDRGLEIDHFVIYTDSETWAGAIHPAQALRRYRERSGIPARLSVVGMVSNGFSIADPDDGGMLDLVGFDTAAPQVMADFAAGRI